MELRHVQPFRQLLEAVLGRKTRFRDVEKDDKGGGCTIHLNPNAAAALDDSPPELMSFLDSIGAEYLPGVWKKRKLQEEPKVSCFETVKKPHKQAASSSFTFVELFAGIGGFRLGLESIGGRCVLASELNSHAASIYRQNFDHNCLVQGDILDLDSSCCGQFDMLTAGFPCQPFTDRGQKRGLDDDRGQMYLELVRILHDQQPRCFLFENVVGLVTMQGGSRTKRTKGERTTFEAGRVFERILDSFASCGYNVDWKVINSRHFLPQQRERVYIVGTRLDLNCGSLDWDGLLPRNSLDTTVRSILEPKDSSWVKACELSASQWNRVQALHRKHKTNPFSDSCIDLEAKAPTLISSYHRVSNLSTKFLFEEADGTLCNGKGDNSRPRFLSPRECCRVMGFPEDFVVPSPSDGPEVIAHFYRGIGNAVTPPVIGAIGKELLQCIQNSTLV